MRCHRHELVCQREQKLQHLVHVLVGHDAEQKDEFLAGETVVQTLDRGPHPVGVVAAVQQEGGRVPQQLEPARPADGLQTLPDGLLRDVPALFPQHPQHRDGDGGIPGLVAANERQAHPVQAVEVKGHFVQVAALHGQLREIDHMERGVLLCRRAGDDGVGLRHTAVAHHRAARLEDARLGRCDVRDGGAKFLHMVHAQCRDDRTLRRVDDVGGIQRTAQTHFQYHNVAVLLGKAEHPQRCDDLELGGHIGHGICGRPDRFHQAHQFLVADLLAVHLNALIEPVDEGRGVQPHPIPRRLQAGRQHGCGASLAVGARHMDELQPFVGVAQRSQKGAGAGQAGLMPRPLHRVDVLHCFFVVHDATFLQRDPLHPCRQRGSGLCFFMLFGPERSAPCFPAGCGRGGCSPRSAPARWGCGQPAAPTGSRRRGGGPAS